MGRGGSSGGGFSGGGNGGSHHSFSSSNSRGGSSHSSSSSSHSYSHSPSCFGRSRLSGGTPYSSYRGSWHRSSFDMPTYHSETVWTGSDTPVYSSGRYMNRQRRTIVHSLKFDAIVWLVTILFCILLFVSMTAYENGSSSEVTKSTHQRTKLSAEQCIESKEWYHDGWGDWLNNDLLPGLRHFYEKTGVQPYVYIMGGEEAEKYRTQQSLYGFDEDLYEKLFGTEDQGHLILTWSEYPNGSGVWVADIYTGTDADLVVDDEGAQILQDYLVQNYSNDVMTDSEFISYAFQDAADRMMTVQKTGTQKAMVFFGIIMVCITTVVIVKQIKKRKAAQKEKEKADEVILNSDIKVPEDTTLEILKNKYKEDKTDE